MKNSNTYRANVYRYLGMLLLGLLSVMIGACGSDSSDTSSNPKLPSIFVVVPFSGNSSFVVSVTNPNGEFYSDSSNANVICGPRADLEQIAGPGNRYIECYRDQIIKGEYQVKLLNTGTSPTSYYIFVEQGSAKGSPNIDLTKGNAGLINSGAIAGPYTFLINASGNLVVN